MCPGDICGVCEMLLLVEGRGFTFGWFWNIIIPHTLVMTQQIFGDVFCNSWLLCQWRVIRPLFTWTFRAWLWLSIILSAFINLRELRIILEEVCVPKGRKYYLDDCCFVFLYCLEESGFNKCFINAGVPKLNRAELVTACEDFSNIIETHNYFTVYKGTLSSGVEVAVFSTTINSLKDWSAHSEQVYRKKVNCFFSNCRFTLDELWFLESFCANQLLSFVDWSTLSSEPQEFC